MDTQISENQKTWDAVAHEFFDASALPVWGPFGIGEDLNLITKIKDKTFLEVACGSGRSIKYLLDNGATKVYGLDLSGKQLEEAKRFNNESVDKGTAVLIQVRKIQQNTTQYKKRGKFHVVSFLFVESPYKHELFITSKLQNSSRSI